MGLINLTVYSRTETGKNENRRTRSRGRIPAVIYGKERESANVEVDEADFARIHQQLKGSAAIFNLSVDGETDNPIALLREVQRHPVSDVYLHVDLFEIPRGVPVEVEVPLILEGDPQVVKFNEGEVLQTLDTIAVSCLPREMPDSITLDVSELEMHDRRFVKDLTTTAGEILNDPEEQILLVKPVSIFVEEDEELEGEEGAEGEGDGEGEEGAEDDSEAEDKDD